MKVFLTGSSGFLGEYCLKALRDNGVDVTTTHRKKNYLNNHLNNSYFLDLNDLDSISKLDLAGYECVIHCAGLAHKDSTYENHIRINSHATKLLFKQSIKCRVKKFIFISTIGVYGSRAASIVNEDSATLADSNYSRSKLQAEQEIINLKNNKTSFVILRPPIILGDSSPGSIMRLRKLINHSFPLPFKNIKNNRSIIEINELVNIIHLIISNHIFDNKIFNVSNEVDISTTELIYKINPNARLFSIPIFLQKTLSKIKKPQFFYQLYGDYQIDSSKIREHLNSINS